MEKKKNPVQYLVIALLVIAVAWVGYTAYDNNQTKKAQQEAQEKAQQERVNKQQEQTTTADETIAQQPDVVYAPDFEAANLGGQKETLSSYQGKKVVLNFWASWCPPCKAEMPHMVDFQNQHAADLNTEIVAVNLTQQEKSGIGGIKKFVDEYGLNFPVLLDETGAIATQYGIITIPTTFILNEDGAIERQITGPVTDDLLIKLLGEMDE